jgi:adenylate kinase family enzyme
VAAAARRFSCSEVMRPRLESGKLVIQLKLDYTEVISRIAGRERCSCYSVLDDPAVSLLIEVGKCDRRMEAPVRRKDDRENAVWDGLETCGRPPRRALNYFALSDRPSCGVDRNGWSPKRLSGRMSGCMVLE